MKKFVRSIFLELVAVAFAAGIIAGCGSRSSENASTSNPPLRHQAAEEGCCAGKVFRTRATGYYPAADRMEGGHVDRRGKKLRTLQDFVDGRATYVSVAMDSRALPYGRAICIPALNESYGKAIDFRVVDTGGAFKNKGTTRLDICTRSRSDAFKKNVNRKLEIVVCDP